MINLLVDATHSFERTLLKELAESCGATAASIIRIDRSGRNKRESQGLLFEQLAKWLSPNANTNNRSWEKPRDEFFGKYDSWGTAGALFTGRIVDVRNIKAEADRATWYGDSLDYNSSTRTRVKIKPKYCEMEELIGSPLKDMLVAPVHSNNIVVGAIKLFNHAFCRECRATTNGFEQHLDDATSAAARLSEEWLNTYPIRCEVATVFIDVTDSTSFLIASGYYDGARVFQVFCNALQKEISKVAEEINNRPGNSRAALYGGIPFLDKFTGDGVLLIFPYDRLPLPDEERIEKTHIWPHVKQVVGAAHRAWQSILDGAECRRVLREAAMSRDPLRIAISSGPAYIGKFGGHLSAIGRPLIEASRILSHTGIHKASFNAEPSSPFILASHQLVEDFQLDYAKRLEERWTLRGLPGERFVYKVPIDH